MAEIEKDKRIIKLKGMVSRTGEKKIKSILVGPFDSHEDATKWLERNKFVPADSGTTKYLKKGESVLEMPNKVLGPVDVLWADIIRPKKPEEVKIRRRKRFEEM